MVPDIFIAKTKRAFLHHATFWRKALNYIYLLVQFQITRFSKYSCLSFRLSRPRSPLSPFCLFKAQTYFWPPFTFTSINASYVPLMIYSFMLSEILFYQSDISHRSRKSGKAEPLCGTKDYVTLE